MQGKLVTLAIIHAMTWALVACGAEEPVRPPRSTPVDEGGEGDANKNAPTSIEAPLEQDQVTDELGKGGDAALELAHQCGDLDFNKSDTQLVNLAMKSLPLVTKGQRPVLGFPVSYEVSAVASLGIKADLASTVTTLTFEQVTASSRFSQKSAEDEAKQKAGTVMTELARVQDRAKLAETVPGWKDIVCTVQPGLRTTSVVGAGKVAVAFDPPLPASLSPHALKERYEQEIGAARTWSGIKALVQQSSHPAVKTRMVYTGTMTLTPIEPTLVVKGTDGTQQTIKADLAFELTADFGSTEITTALGLTPSTKFYVDLAAHAFKAVVTNANDGTSAAAVFVAP